MSTEVTGQKMCPQRGTRIKSSISTVEIEITGRKNRNRNPFPEGGRLHGYFSAILAQRQKQGAERPVLFDQLAASCLKDEASFGIEDTIEAIEKDLANHISAWISDKSGHRGLHLRFVRVDGPGRCAPGKKGEAKYRFIGFKPDSKYASAAREMGWTVG